MIRIGVIWAGLWPRAGNTRHLRLVSWYALTRGNARDEVGEGAWVRRAWSARKRDRAGAKSEIKNQADFLCILAVINLLVRRASLNVFAAPRRNGRAMLPTSFSVGAENHLGRSTGQAVQRSAFRKRETIHHGHVQSSSNGIRHLPLGSAPALLTVFRLRGAKERPSRMRRATLADEAESSTIRQCFIMPLLRVVRLRGPRRRSGNRQSTVEKIRSDRQGGGHHARALNPGLPYERGLVRVSVEELQ